MPSLNFQKVFYKRNCRKLKFANDFLALIAAKLSILLQNYQLGGNFPPISIQFLSEKGKSVEWLAYSLRALSGPVFQIRRLYLCGIQ